MIHLFSDFGLEGPYIGQVKAVLGHEAPGAPVVDLVSDAPACNPRAASYLLAAYDRECREGDVVIGVVDPCVGGERAALSLLVDGCWYVGPDNGLFHAVIDQGSDDISAWRIAWCPARLSASFHGRDLFAPIAARLALGEGPSEKASADFDPIHIDKLHRTDWPADSTEVVYIDRFGNLITGLRAATLARKYMIEVDGQVLASKRTFSDVSPGEAFCYENANGLLEIAVNQGSAAAYFHLSIGDEVTIK